MKMVKPNVANVHGFDVSQVSIKRASRSRRPSLAELKYSRETGEFLGFGPGPDA